ncbi:MAG TPA: hypothetical protein VMT02_02685 [Burkholderiales bacterium]|jgi:hypothetical protein|nr:hypothetical protein [Burkholderiales bacterium]
MDTAMVGALSGVLGSLIGGTATAATTWVSQNRLNRREILREELRKRETLYGEFIGECARLLMDALGHTLEKPETLLPAYALLNRIRLCASQPVLARAEELTRHITDQYFARNLTVEEFRSLAHSNEADPLRSFGEACRAELKSLRGRI